MKILHVATDEKFIDSAIDQFTWYEKVESSFFICCLKENVKYIRSTAPNVFFYDNATALVDAVNAMDADFVLLHSLCIDYAQLLRIRHRIIWKIWGYDFYSDKYDRIQRVASLDLYSPKTRMQTTSAKMKRKHVLRSMAGLFGIKNDRQKQYDSLISKIEYIAPVFYEEYELAKKRFPHLKYCPFQYFSAGKNNLVFEDVAFEKPYSIFIGNSLDPTNNHLDILNKLDDLHCTVQTVIPISYSGNLAYKEYLKTGCADLKNVKVRFLESFMPRSEYFKLASTCPFAIYGHQRQQAAGNIGQMLKNGVKVFLYKESINYKYYSSCGYKVFTIDDDLNEENLREPLAADFVLQNRNAYSIHENVETYTECMKKFWDKIESRS